MNASNGKTTSPLRIFRTTTAVFLLAALFALAVGLPTPVSAQQEVKPEEVNLLDRAEARRGYVPTSLVKEKNRLENPLESRLMKGLSGLQEEKVYQDPNYVLGPGDQVEMTVWGKYSFEGVFQVNSRGVLAPKAFSSTNEIVDVPSWFEDIPAGGVTLASLERTIDELLGRQLAMKYWLSLNLRQARILKVTTLGEVAKPQSFYINSIQTIENVIQLAGGITEAGSVRRIEIKDKTGLVKRTIDLYPYLTLGMTGQNLTLESGDIIFVPVKSRTIAVSGQVNKPGIYEFLEGETLGDILNYAGGTTPEAALEQAFVERPATDSRKDYIPVPLTEASAANSFQLTNGDLLFVPDQIRTQDNITLVLPNNTQVLLPIAKGKPILDYYDDLAEYLGPADLSRITVVRGKDGNAEIHEIDLESLLQKQDLSQNFVFEPGDKLFLSDLQNVVYVMGEVKRPSGVSYSKNKEPIDYVSLAGGPTQIATLSKVILIRRDPLASPRTQYLDLRQEKKDGEDAVQMQPGDMLIVNQRPERAVKKLTSIINAVVPYIYLFR